MNLIILKGWNDLDLLNYITLKNNLNKNNTFILEKRNMLDYGRAAMTGAYGGNDFAAMPKVVQSKQKYKDPYSKNSES